MHSEFNLNIVRHWLTVHFMCFHRTLNASHSNARHWRMWATTAKRAAAKTNGFLICPCKNAERVAMLDAMKGWTSHSLRMKAKGLQPPLTAVSCEGAVKLLGLCARDRYIPPCPTNLWRNKLWAHELWKAACRRKRCRRTCTRAAWACVGKRRVCVTIAACGTNIFKCRVNDLCIMCRTLVTMNCSGIYAKLQVDCIRFCSCTENDSVCETKLILLSYWD